MAKKADKPGMPAGRPNQCTARTKTCRACSYRYKKGDKSWHCPKCGEERRCTNNAVEDRNVCRMHGGYAGRPPSQKYRIAKDLTAAFSHAVSHPDLLNLNQEIALMAARQTDLMDRFENQDVSGVAKLAMRAANDIETGIVTGNMTMTAEGLTELRRALDPAMIQQSIWFQMQGNFEVIRRLQDTERRWLAASKQAISIEKVLELVLLLQRIMFRYIPTAQDRSECAREIRGYLPRKHD